MAYTNAIFYIDLVSGSDAARTALTGCIASNPSGTITRINKTSHGLVTGAVVDLTLFSAWLNGAWKITKVDNDNFDLDTAVWQATADANGTVTPRGGSSWTDAWLTPTSGATAARVAAGDEVRLNKSDDPVSIGNATWTSLSSTITLATAQTKIIDNCEVAWTAANSATVTRETSNPKQGTYRMLIRTPSTGTTTNTKYGFYDLGTTLDLSAFQQITLWSNSGTTTTTGFEIKLCSDTTGDTVVDSFVVPTLATNQWIPRTISRTGGGNLGNAIKSIAVYSSTVSPGNNVSLRLDNISASATNGLNLNVLIGQSSNGYSLDKPWNNIQSITDTTVIIDRITDTISTGAVLSKGYYTEGTSPATVTTYILNPRLSSSIQTTTNGAIYTLNTAGTATAFVKWTGGWNTSSNTQDGVSWFDNRYSPGGVLFYNTSPKNYNSFSRIGFSKMFHFFNCSTSTNAGDVEVMGTGVNEFSAQSLEVNSATGYIVNSTVNFRNFSGPSIQNIISYNNNDSVNLGSAQTAMSYVNNVTIGNLAGRAWIPQGPMIAENISVKYCTDTTNGVFDTSQLNSLTAYKNITITDNTGYGIALSGGRTTINNLVSNNNSLAAIRGIGNGSLYLNNPTITDSTLISQATNNYSATYITNLNGSATDSRFYYDYGNGITQTSVRKSATGVAWQVNVTKTKVRSATPLKLSVAKIACTGNKQVTVKAWVKLSHATDIGAKLAIRGGQLPGVTNDVTATKSADTNWEELTISFTPTIAGVAEIELWSYWLANTADESTYIDDMTITEAA